MHARLRRTLLLAAALVVVSPTSRALDFTVVSWGGVYQDTQRDVYFRPFMKETGLRIAEQSWDGNIDALRQKVKTGSSDWTIVQVEPAELIVGCEEGLFDKIEWPRLGGKERFLPGAVHDCGLGATVYSFVLAYDGDRVQGDGPKNWADFWNVQRWPGKRGLRKTPKTSLEIALLADGVAPQDVYRQLSTDPGIERAITKLGQLTPHIVWWEKPAEAIELLTSGAVIMSEAYHGWVVSANVRDSRHLMIVWTNSLYTVDSWAIVKDGPQKALAYFFLNFVSRPIRQKDFASRLPYGVTAIAANSMIDPTVAKNLPTAAANFQSALQLDEVFWLHRLDDIARRFNADPRLQSATQQALFAQSPKMFEKKVLGAREEIYREKIARDSEGTYQIEYFTHCVEPRLQPGGYQCISDPSRLGSKKYFMRVRESGNYFVLYRDPVGRSSSIESFDTKDHHLSTSHDPTAIADLISIIDSKTRNAPWICWGNPASGGDPIKYPCESPP